jgi:hypothetical protein
MGNHFIESNNNKIGNLNKKRESAEQIQAPDSNCIKIDRLVRQLKTMGGGDNTWF